MLGDVDEGTLSDRQVDRPPGEPSEPVVLRKVARRLVPFLFVLYLANILDRNNIAFARLQMLADLGLDEGVYGWGATFCFYLGYLLFEVPSNLILHRVGARLWIGRIMITWGLVFNLHDVRAGGAGLLRGPDPARRGRGRVFPRDRALSQLLVPGAERCGPWRAS